MKPGEDCKDENDFYGQALKYIAGLNPSLPESLGRVKEFGEKNNVPIIDDELGYFLRLISQLHQPGKILEIGCGISYSTHWMLLGSASCEIIAVDSNKFRLEQCERFLNLSGNRNRVKLHHSWVNDFFKQNEESFDLIFLDSTKKEYIDLLDLCYHSLNPGGLFVVDNIFYNRKMFGLLPEQEKKYGNATRLLQKFNDAMSKHPGFNCTFLPLSDGVLIAKREK